VQCGIVCDFVKVGVKMESRVSRADMDTLETPSDAPFRDDHNGAAYMHVGLLCVRPGPDK